MLNQMPLVQVPACSLMHHSCRCLRGKHLDISSCSRHNSNSLGNNHSNSSNSQQALSAGRASRALVPRHLAVQWRATGLRL